MSDRFRVDGDTIVLRDGKRVPYIRPTQNRVRWKDWDDEHRDWVLQWYKELTVPEMEDILNTSRKTIVAFVIGNHQAWWPRPIAEERARTYVNTNIVEVAKARSETIRHTKPPEHKKRKCESLEMKKNKTLDDKMRSVRHVEPRINKRNKLDVIERSKELLKLSRCTKKCVLYGKFPCNKSKPGDTCYDVIATKIYELNMSWELKDLDPNKNE